jgi:hypothetical protein
MNVELSFLEKNWLKGFKRKRQKQDINCKLREY